MESNLIIIPRNSSKFRLWGHAVLGWAIFSVLMTPVQFGFVRGLSQDLQWMDFATQTVFIVDILLQFIVAFKEPKTDEWIVDPGSIAQRYARRGLYLDIMSCMPWELIFVVAGEKEIFKWFLLVRLSRLSKVQSFFEKLKTDYRINQLLVRAIKLLLLQLYFAHVTGCFFYYLATRDPHGLNENTWIGSYALSNYSFHNLQQVSLWRRYTLSLYFAIMTVATIGYGDIHAISEREIVFVIIFVASSMMLNTYIFGSIVAHMVKAYEKDNFGEAIKCSPSLSSTKCKERNIEREMERQMEDSCMMNIAAYFGNVSRLKDLIRCGADAKLSDYNGKTPLHLAAERGHKEIVEFLLKADCGDWNAKDRNGLTPLSEAIKGGHDDVMRLFEHFGAR